MDALKTLVREKYGEAARRTSQGEKATCGCGTSGCCGPDPITSDLYDDAQAATVPSEALLASLGCGNPTALAELQPGEIVLDLGSGGGIDVLLSAKRVGATGKAYGLDMTDDMLSLARENQRRSGLTNVEFIKGEIEHIPLPDASVDVVISNCVINLSGDKQAVVSEAYRVLRPGGRLAIADVVFRDSIVSDALRGRMELWAGCIAGALEERRYRELLSHAGFTNVDIEPTRIYGAADARGLLTSAELNDEALVAQVDGRVMSAFVRARKPGAPARACCADGCCASQSASTV